MAVVTNKEELIEIIKHYADILKREIRLDAVYLFGSYARGEAHPDSDIDVLVVSPDFTDDIIQNQMLLLKARRKIDIRIEPHALSSDSINHSILYEQVSGDLEKVI